MVRAMLLLAVVAVANIEATKVADQGSYDVADEGG